jgi:hypothetical protein
VPFKANHDRRHHIPEQRHRVMAITTALTPRAVFRLALRQTEGLIASILWLLGLDLAAPDHSTLSRRGQTLRPRPGSEPVHLLVDSTGLKLCGPGEWLVEKHATRTRRSWRTHFRAVRTGAEEAGDPSPLPGQRPQAPGSLPLSGLGRADPVLFRRKCAEGKGQDNVADAARLRGHLLGDFRL